MADVALYAPAVIPAGQGYTVPGSMEIIVKSVRASFDGTAAAGSYVPTLQIVSDGGVVVAECPLDSTLTAGASADVSWFPGVGISASSVTASGGYVLIQDMLLNADTQTIDFTSIPQTYGSLYLIFKLRSTQAATSSTPNLIYNNATGVGNGYETVDLSGTGSSTSGGTPFLIPGATADTAHFSYGFGTIFDYSPSQLDHGSIFNSYVVPQISTPAGWHTIQRAVQACFANPWSLNRVTIDAVSPNKLAAGSRATLYGLALS